jgi:hypothetical protein
MACITCGASMKPDEKAIIRYFKQVYDTHKIVRWVYVQQGNVKVTRDYKTIPKGVEYFHISEWNG